jgi:hypothetical protein
MYRVCLRANKALFKENPSLKYEMSIELEALFENMHDEKDDEDLAEGGSLSSAAKFAKKTIVTKENFDKVDLLI